MAPILQQLGLDSTFFIQFILITLIYVALTHVLFRPFQKLFELRHARTVEDRRVAEELLAQAEAKKKEYEERLTVERKAVRGEIDLVIQKAKTEESKALTEAREDAKKVIQAAAVEFESQKTALRTQLTTEVSKLAHGVVEKLLTK